MGSLDAVKRFLDSASYREACQCALDVRRGAYPFVTISRKTGAGGRSLAQALIRRMEQEPDRELFGGWQVFDQQLCAKLLEDPRLKVSFQSLLSEEYRGQIEDLLYGFMADETPQEIVIKKTFKTVRTLATVGKVILVGRAGACVTRGLPLGVHVRLVASELSCAHRMMDLLRVGEAEARKTVQKQDADRARLVRDYFRRDINDPLLYDAVWNTDAVGFDALAACIVELINQRVAAHRAGTCGCGPACCAAPGLRQPVTAGITLPNP